MNIFSASNLNLLNISQFVLQVGVPSYPVPLPQFRHKIRKEFSVTVNVTVWKGNYNVSFSAEGTATHEAGVTAADCPNSRLRGSTSPQFSLLLYRQM